MFASAFRREQRKTIYLSDIKMDYVATIVSNGGVKGRQVMVSSEQLP